MKSYEMDMCSGPLFRRMLVFTVPLICSGMLQLFFNAADIIVVGKFSGEHALAAVGSTSSLINLLLNLVIGISLGASVIVGRNYGAKNKKRLLEALSYSMIICAGINLLGTILFWIFSKEILSCFNAFYEILEIGIPALKIISTSFVLGSICFIFSCFFQSLGMGVTSLLITLLRQFLILIPLAFVLGNIFGLKGVWWSFIIAELITCICSLIIYKYHSEKDLVLKKI